MVKFKKRIIIHNCEPQYFVINIREKRCWTIDYFNEVNKGHIPIRYIEENKLFNKSDYYYLKNIERWRK